SFGRSRALPGDHSSGNTYILAITNSTEFDGCAHAHGLHLCPMIGHRMRTHRHSCAPEVGYESLFMVHGTERRLGIGFWEFLQQRAGMTHSAFNLPKSIAAMKKAISHFRFPISTFRIRTFSLRNANRIQ